MYELLTFFFLVAAHYLPYENWLPWKWGTPVRLIINYVIGTVGMLAPFVYWLYQQEQTVIIWKLIGFVIAAGLAPVFTHWNDTLKSTRETAKEKTEESDLLKKQLQDRRDEA